MTRGRFLFMTMMMCAALFAGVIVGSLAPPLGSVSAQDLKLAPPPATTASVIVPSFAELAERAIPSVVQIRNTMLVSPEGPSSVPGPLRRFFEQLPDDENHRFQDGQRSPRRERRQSGGSGFFITTDGYIMTNRHVVENADSLEVLTSDDRTYVAKLIGIDPHLDLAVIKIEPAAPVPALPLGNSEALRIGEWVVAIGNPLAFRNSVTVGVVSGKERALGAGTTDIGDYVQTDAAINFGNSGGPLLNARGEVVGINTAIVRGNGSSVFGSEQAVVEGLGFALPITQAKRSLEQLIETGTVKRGYMGVTVRPVTPVIAESYGYTGNASGALIETISDGSPAARAGLKQGDIILTVEGREIRSSNDLVNVVSAFRPSDKVKLELWRANRKTDVIVTLTERPDAGNDESSTPSQPEPSEKDDSEVQSLGLTVGPVPPDLRERLQELGHRGGVLIKDVDESSEAAREDVVRGLIVLDVNGTPTPTVEDFRKATAGIGAGKVVRMRLLDQRGNERLFFFRVGD